MFRGQFVSSLLDYAKQDPTIHIITADLGFTLFDKFRESCPEQFMNIGVAEANMVSVAAGMSLAGANVFVYSMVPFVTSRAMDQIRVDVSGHNSRVKIVGVGAGVGYGMEGLTHFALEDIGLMRAFPNMTVVCPADISELRVLLPHIINSKTPVYLRLVKGKADDIYTKPLTNISLGRAIEVRAGKKQAILSYGSALKTAVLAADILERENQTKVGVYSFPTLKPIDRECIQSLIQNYECLFTVEEHSVIGGLGTIISEALLEMNFKGTLRKIAFPDKFPEVMGHGEYLCKWAGVTSEKVVATMREHL
ncbi:MAG: transketolase C-terminal domain-containing protein [Pseudomonadota bacterium]|nr:transketolase C-terminal domain-containing protein [Pseudomonadota bacterium]